MKKNKEFTKEEFLKRCSAAWDAGYVNRWGLVRARNALDLVMRLKASYERVNRIGSGNDVIGEIGVSGAQGDWAIDALLNEVNTESKKKLAGDTEAYNSIQLLACLAHPCQICAEDKDAWHTRWGFCPHREKP
jgi:hypothetical protein